MVRKIFYTINSDMKWWQGEYNFPTIDTRHRFNVDTTSYVYKVTSIARMNG